MKGLITGITQNFSLGQNNKPNSQNLISKKRIVSARLNLVIKLMDEKYILKALVVLKTLRNVG